ncbi:MAG: precorrin-3B C(17)-methyltransferase [Termitinemataceae bacterium]|nr:MAG: precorrin-3B C(17)-methyltransferase [Termitinemataceae bacterium]
MAKLTVAGIGPGDEANMSIACRRSLDECDVIAGYTAYIELVQPLYPNKTYLSTGMKSEVERCTESLRIAANGKNVCLISSGDSGIYGMASLVYELAVEFPAVQIEVIAGITAASSGSAILGSPLSHDFAVISLSDLLTPWELIEKRLRAASDADFVISIYNPVSHKRKDHLKNAAAILLEAIPADRICGIAHNIGREGQDVTITTLGGLQKDDSAERLHIDMFCCIFIGNSKSKMINGKMITPRGYTERK